MTATADASRLYTPRKYNATTKQRFARDRWRRLIAHLGGSATDVQKILLGRLIDLEWEAARLAARRDEGKISDHDYRVFMALQNHVRLLGRELGLKAEPKERVPTLEEVAEQILAEKQKAAAE